MERAGRARLRRTPLAGAAGVAGRAIARRRTQHSKPRPARTHKLVRPSYPTQQNQHHHPHKVTIKHGGETHELDVPSGTSILEAALDKGIDLPHDCKLGVCMTCPAKLVSGSIDQTGSMLSDDVEEKGFALLCMACPQSDVEVVTCTEEELLDVQLCA